MMKTAGGWYAGRETNTGDFTADALYYLFDEMDMDVDVAIMNGGGIRNGAITGELTFTFHARTYTLSEMWLCLMEVSGQQILDALENGAPKTTVPRIRFSDQVDSCMYQDLPMR